MRRLQKEGLHGKVLHALKCTEIGVLRPARRYERMGQREGAKGLLELREHFYQHFAASTRRSMPA